MGEVLQTLPWERSPSDERSSYNPGTRSHSAVALQRARAEGDRHSPGAFSLDDQMAIYSAPSEGVFFLGVTALVKVKDGARVRKSLETALKNHRIEEHRTRTPTYREQILQEEKLIEQLLIKLGHTPK